MKTLHFFSVILIFLCCHNLYGSAIFNETDSILELTPPSIRNKAASRSMLPDSTIQTNVSSNYISKIVYQYDDNGNTLQEVTYLRSNDAENWQLNNKVEYGYDIYDNQTLKMSFNWDNANNSWKGTTKNEYSFDDNGHSILDISYVWNSTSNNWIESVKIEKSYPGPSNIYSGYRYEWDSTTSIWNPKIKTECIYSNDNSEATGYTYTYDNTNGWQNKYKYLYYFDQNNIDTLYYSYKWDSSTANFKLASRTQYKYNENGKIIAINYDTWDITNQNWINGTHGTCSYNDAGNQSVYENYSWNSANNLWKGILKTVDEYDNSGEHKIKDTWYSWDDTNQNWAPISQHEYKNNDNGSLGSYNYYLYQSGNFTLYSNNVYYYPDYVTSSFTEKETNIALYPNPTKDMFQICGLNGVFKVVISDINGSQLISKKITSDETINVSSLTKGIYLVRTENNNIIHCFRLIKE